MNCVLQVLAVVRAVPFLSVQRPTTLALELRLLVQTLLQKLGMCVLMNISMNHSF